MKKSIISITILLVTATIAYTQVSMGIRNAVAIDVLSALNKTISVSYSYSFDNSYEMRINPRISFDSQRDNTIMGISIEDPYWYYDTYGIQLGINRLLYKKFYVEPIVHYKYGEFESREIKTEDSEGDRFDEYQLLDRDYHSFGLALQTGLRMDNGNFRFNYYFGVGYHMRYYNEKIKEMRYWNTLIPGDYPIDTNYWKDGVSLYLGIRIGFRI